MNVCKICTKKKIPKSKIETHDKCIFCESIKFKLLMLLIDGNWCCKTCFKEKDLSFKEISKQCKKCKKFISLFEYSLDRGKKDGRHSVCKDCKLKYRKGFKINSIVPPIGETKVCNQCNEEKSIKLFSARRSNIDGLAGECKECMWNRDKKWRSKNPEKTRNKFLKQKYGISLDEYNMMYEKQKGCCYICEKKNKNEQPLHVDHCHKTNTVRKLLCMHCNHILGSCFEDINILYNTINYIKEHNESTNEMGFPT